MQPSKTVLVTGGAGFIGSATAKVFLSRGDRVVVVDELNDYYDIARKEENIKSLETLSRVGQLTIIRGDICDKTLMESVFAAYKPSVVCHLAARAGVRASIDDPLIYIHSNIEGTTILLELSRLYSVSNFVYASSSSVYGESTADKFRESDEVSKPVSPYAATKVSCELLASTYHHLYNLNVTGLRFFTVYGPNGRPDMAPYKFIDRIFRGLPIDQYGDGSTMRDYTFIDDIVDGVVRSCDYPHPCAVYNLGNGSPVVLSEFISTIESLVGRKATIRHLPFQAGDVSRTCADITLAKRDLGYFPQTSLREGLRRTVEWYKSTIASKVIHAPTPAVSALPDEITIALSPMLSSESLSAVAAKIKWLRSNIPSKEIVVPVPAPANIPCLQGLLNDVTFIEYPSWGGDAMVRNAVLSTAVKSRTQYILFLPAGDVPMLDKEAVDSLIECFTDDVLCVVASDYSDDSVKESNNLNLTLWNVAKLARTGFIFAPTSRLSADHQVVATQRKLFPESSNVLEVLSISEIEKTMSEIHLSRRVSE